MKLKELIKGVKVNEIIGKNDLEIGSVQTDSNRACKNSLFIAIKGNDYNGADFIRQVESAGATAVVTEEKINTSITQVIVNNCREAVSLIADNFYQNVSKKMTLIGVTGTNGKTSTTHLISQILNNLGEKCGVIGTLGVFYGNNYLEPTLTTPDPLILNKILYDMYNDGYKTVVMEISAHAIYYKKINNLKFKVGIFTNCTRDHLDFFKDYAVYKEVKKSFFESDLCEYAVVNVDDEVGGEIVKSRKNTVTYGIDNPADVFAMDIVENEDNSNFILNLFDEVFFVKTKLLGKFNVYNLLSSATACALTGQKIIKIGEKLKSLNGVKGRIECVFDGDFKVFIDYAHTPDGLENILSTLRKITKNKLICVFGCGGNRDKGKRKEMGKISGKYADFTVITSDNPRFEEPMDIIFDIEKGIISTTKQYVIVQDRYLAIEYALNMALPNDVIVIAGKGSENYQEILGIKRPYNDKDTVKEILRRKRN